MSFRPTRRSRRPSSSCIGAAARFDALEGRLMMSTVSPTGTLCMCAACVAARAAVATGATNVQATIKPLAPVASLAKSVRTAVQKAGADLFDSVAALGTAANGQSDHLKAISLTPFSLDLKGLQTKLRAAPAEFTTAAADGAVVLALPTPSGTLERFKIVTSQVMDPKLAVQFPTIKTYRGVGIDDPTADIRLDTTPAGLHVQVLAGDGTFYIDPYFTNDAKGTYASYFKADAVSSGVWTCSTMGTDVQAQDGSAATALELAQADGASVVPSIVYGGTLKTYRAAVAGNRPYVVAATSGVAGGATVANGVAAVVTAMNRVTGVYETELGIRMTLVANEAAIVYGTDNPNPDPYTNSTAALSQNTGNLNTRIGSTNYDIGHVFTTGSGGVAQLGCVGGSNKGAGTTGVSVPLGDSFTIDYVAHEMGHQFGANHTFNTSGDTGNRSAAHAYEPGSGLSIMAYAGIESADDLAGHSIAYFHSESVDEIRTFITNSIPGVGVASPTGDVAPTVNAGLDYIIPTGTPFALTATGSDADGDALTYDWQQRDKGAATALSTADNGTSPLFTEINPSASPTRTLPRLNSILGGFANTVAGGTSASAANVLGAGSNTLTARLAERMYAVARTASTWRVTARDNRGGLATDDLILTVVNTGAAFAISTLNTATTLPGGSSQTLTWNVAGTTGSGINAANVNILLSTDGGATFPISLAANTANDGTESIQVPFNLGSTTARIKVQPTNNVFFDINNANLTITNVVSNGSQTPAAPLLDAASDSGVSNSDRLTNVSTGATFTIGNTVAGAFVELLDGATVVGTATAAGATTVVTVGTTLADGPHAFTVRQTETGKTVSNASAATSVTVDTVAGATPTLLDLVAASDSGVSNSDNVTNDNTPTFTLAGTETYFRLTRDGTTVGSDYSTATSLTETTVADGSHAYALSSVDAAGNLSAALALAVTIDTVAPAAPTSIGLDPASDTGISNTDRITNDATPTVLIASSDAYSRLTRDGVPVGGNYATATSYTDAAQTDGTHAYAARSVDAAGNVSAASSTVIIEIDTDAPTLAAPTVFNFETEQSVAYAFSEDLAASFTPASFTVTLDGGGAVTANVTYDAATATAVVRFPALLANGNYTATLAGLTDVAGNAVATDTLPFFVLAGDANRDRTVDFTDLLTLAQNYGLTGQTFSQGNFDYTPDGTVDFSDLLILAQNYGVSQPALVAANPLATTTGRRDRQGSSASSRVGADVLA